MEDDLNQITSFGCVILIEEIPHLYIMDDEDEHLLDGIPLFDDNELYTTLYNNELIIVGVSITTSDGEEIIDYDYIDDDNYNELTYTVIPLKFHTLKTKGLTIEDMVDLDLIDLLINDLIDTYIDNL